MATKTVYICDNCKTEASTPVKWINVSDAVEGKFGVTAFKAHLVSTKSFCGEACALNFISTQLPKLFKEPLVYEPSSNEEVEEGDKEAGDKPLRKGKKLEEFLYGPKL